MVRSSNRLLAAAIGGLLVVGLAGCSSDNRPTAEKQPSPVVSVPPTAEPSAEEATRVITAPERPAEIEDDGPAGADAAAKYFLELDGYIQASGDTAVFEAMSHDTCEFCAARIEQARQIADERAIYEGGSVRAEILHTYEQDAATGIWPIDVEITQNAATVTSADGEPIAEVPYAKARKRVEIARRDGSWVVIGVADLPS